jgi:hypothetical protein
MKTFFLLNLKKVCHEYNFLQVVILFTFSEQLFIGSNGTAHFKNANNCLNTDIYSYLEASGGQSYNLYLNVVHFFNSSLNYTSAAA